MATQISPATLPSAWARFWRWFADVGERTALGYDGIQDQRISRLENELAALRRKVEAPN